MDLRTTYLGLRLKSALIVGASPMTDEVDSAKRLEDAGAGAIVMRSLFEEQITGEKFNDIYHMELYADSYSDALAHFPKNDELTFGPEEYLEHVRKLKTALSIPVIGSLNGTSAGGFSNYAEQIEQAGADAIELNLYSIPADCEESSSGVEQRMIDLVRSVARAVEIPIAVKISPFFTNLAHLAHCLEEAGADGLVMFNRFTQPEINIDAMEVKPGIHLSDPSELPSRLCWTSILSRRVGMDLAVSGGVHGYKDVIKSIMSGASVVQLVSALMRHGPEHLTRLTKEVSTWMTQNSHPSLSQMKGSMGLDCYPDPQAYERAQYMRALNSWSSPKSKVN